MEPVDRQELEELLVTVAVSQFRSASNLSKKKLGVALADLLEREIPRIEFDLNKSVNERDRSEEILDDIKTENGDPPSKLVSFGTLFFLAISVFTTIAYFIGSLIPWWIAVITVWLTAFTSFFRDVVWFATGTDYVLQILAKIAQKLKPKK